MKKMLYCIILIFTMFLSINVVKADIKECVYERASERGEGYDTYILNIYDDYDADLFILEDKAMMGNWDANGNRDTTSEKWDKDIKDFEYYFGPKGGAKKYFEETGECPEYLHRYIGMRYFANTNIYYYLSNEKEVDKYNGELFILKSNVEQLNATECIYPNFKVLFSLSTGKFVGTASTSSVAIYTLNVTKKLQDYGMDLAKDKCPVIHACNKSNPLASSGTNPVYTYDLYPDSIAAEDCDKEILMLRCVGGQYCDTEYNGTCVTYNSEMGKIKTNYNKYLDTKNVSYLNTANLKISELRGLCRGITGFANYNDECFNSCTHLNEELANLGIKAIHTGDCGFSEKLLVWIRNILRWMKYILPIAVIILGIIDFIKAIGADKDDEMKKAQGRFIKRLIAAALAFLLPLIIEFVLGLMGFGYDSCSLF